VSVNFFAKAMSKKWLPGRKFLVSGGLTSLLTASPAVQRGEIHLPG